MSVALPNIRSGLGTGQHTGANGVSDRWRNKLMTVNNRLFTLSVTMSYLLEATLDKPLPTFAKRILHVTNWEEKKNSLARRVEGEMVVVGLRGLASPTSTVSRALHHTPATRCLCGLTVSHVLGPFHHCRVFVMFFLQGSPNLNLQGMAKFPIPP